MRTERAPADAPVTAGLLARNFELIAFSFEEKPFGLTQGGSQDREIRKWKAPITYAMVTPEEDRETVAPRVHRFMDRLRDITGHEIRDHAKAAPDTTANLTVYFGDRDFFWQVSSGLIETNQTAQSLTSSWINSSSPCGGRIRLRTAPGVDGPKGEITSASVVIHKEIPAVLLDACVEEELAQVMGLFDDNLDVRPSAFNDDQEFALVTDHDADLLRILYDARLTPGMKPAQAMPLVREIAGTLRAIGPDDDIKYPAEPPKKRGEPQTKTVSNLPGKQRASRAVE